MPSEDLNVLALVKGEERYIFIFDDENRRRTMEQLGSFAANPELSFTWYDASILATKIRHQLQDVLSDLGVDLPEFRFNAQGNIEDRYWQWVHEINAILAV